MALKIVLGLAAIVVIFLIVAATRPGTLHVTRSILIAAPPENAFAQVNDFHNWSAWSPWEKLDPQMTKKFDGAAAGKGAIYYWTGNSKVGEGRMTIEDSQPPSRVSIKLEFMRPMPGTNATVFSFAPEAGGTKVSWVMDGPLSFPAKAFSIFMDMEKMVGGDFERGLQGLKAIAERGPAAAGN